MPMNKSAARAIDVLELLASSSRALTLTDICQQLALPKSSAFELVNTLLERGAIEYDREELKTFRLGLKVFQIGMSVVGKMDLYREAHRTIEQLSQKTGETTYLAVEKEGQVVYLDKVEADLPIRSSCAIGSTRHMHLTGLGKALLATHTDDEVRAIVGEGELLTYTPWSIATLDRLLEDMKDTRERGYAIDDREGMEYVRCVAAPIRDYGGKAVAAISVAMLDSRLPDERIPEVSEIVIEAALDVSRRLGFSGKKLYF